MIAFLRSLFAAKPAEGRSPKWPAVERQFLRDHPCCEACGTRDDLNVHHVRPFHLRPDLELDPANLITLCRTDHLVLGHLHEWASYNPDCRGDVAAYRTKLDRRPKG